MSRLYFIILLLLLFAGIYVYRRHDSCSILETLDLGDNIKIEIVDEGCKQGLPHTTDKNTIRMTREIQNSERYAEIINHEKVHIDQKRYPEKWANFYKIHWNYKISNSPPSGFPESYILRRRPNPDTDNAPYAIWNDRYLFFPLFATHTGNLRNIDVIVWDIILKTRVEIPEKWKQTFCASNNCPHQYEHPHELAAEYIAKKSLSPAALKLQYV